MSKKKKVKMLPYEKASQYVQKLGIRSQKEYKTWAQSAARPKNIPAAPHVTYAGRGFTTLGAFLGTNRIAKQNMYRPYPVARVFARKLKLKDRAAWRRYVASDACPTDIPKYPNRAYGRRGWNGWEDWLGVEYAGVLPYKKARAAARALKLPGRNAWYALHDAGKAPAGTTKFAMATYKGKGWSGWNDYLGVAEPKQAAWEQAKAYARRLKLRTRQAWMDHCSSGPGRKRGMPVRPNHSFRKEWTTWRDFLGDTFQGRTETLLSFEAARARARELRLRTWADWTKLSKARKLPAGVPSSPSTAYPLEWAGVGDWLGTETVATFNREYRDFAAARAFAISLGLKNSQEWREYAKTPAKPEDIPANPDAVYDDWNSWGHWLGTNNTGRGDFLPFTEARDFARSLGLATLKDWHAYAASGQRPANIPSNPGVSYPREFIGYGDWLGTSNRWARPQVLQFLHNLVPQIDSLDAIDLFKILHHNGLLRSVRHGRDLVGKILNVPHLENARAMQRAIADLAGTLTPTQDDGSPASLGEMETDPDANSLVDLLPAPKLRSPNIEVERILEASDNLEDLYVGNDQDAVRYFVSKGVGRLWQQVLSSEDPATTYGIIQNYAGGRISDQVKEAFVYQYEGSVALPLPTGFSFTKRGKICQPNLMQRLVAWRVQEERRVGNWSGTGAGKTLAAILASRVVASRCTVVFGVEDTLEQWSRDIQNAFPGYPVLTKPREHEIRRLSGHCYVLFNYEALQQDTSESAMRALASTRLVDMVVIDEIHKTKRRDMKLSRRRAVLQDFLGRCAENNPRVAVLGMSATPVINTLGEGLSLLEMITWCEQPDVGRRASVGDIVGVHEKLVTTGVRYKPVYEADVITNVVEVSGDLELARGINHKLTHGLDVSLLSAKIDTIVEQVRRGTVVYSHYVKGVMAPLSAALRAAGYTVGMYIGGDKSGLQDFLLGKIDILLASSAITTGVDGLQDCCNRLIIVSLPWTGAEYDQLVGRFYRQGMKADKVDVIIIQVSILHPTHGEWSWDRARFEHIRNKKTLADAAVDGHLHDDVQESPLVMRKKAMAALRGWIQRVERDEKGLAQAEAC